PPPPSRPRRSCGPPLLDSDNIAEPALGVVGDVDCTDVAVDTDPLVIAAEALHHHTPLRSPFVPLARNASRAPNSVRQEFGRMLYRTDRKVPCDLAATPLSIPAL